MDNAVETLKYVCKKQPIENEFTVFAKHIATQLELPLKAALVAQLDIQSILTRARIHSMNESTNQIVMTATNTTELQFPPSPSDNSNSNVSYSSNDSTNDYIEIDVPNSALFTNLETVHQENQVSNLALFYNNFQM